MFDQYEKRLRELFKDVDEAQKEIAYDTISDYIFYLEENAKLKKLPQIRISPSNPAKQERTVASKMLKDNSQSIANIRKILLMILYRSGGANDSNELINLLKQFE